VCKAVDTFLADFFLFSPHRLDQLPGGEFVKSFFIDIYPGHNISFCSVLYMYIYIKHHCCDFSITPATKIAEWTKHSEKSSDLNLTQNAYIQHTLLCYMLPETMSFKIQLQKILSYRLSKVWRDSDVHCPSCNAP